MPNSTVDLNRILKISVTIKGCLHVAHIEFWVETHLSVGLIERGVECERHREVRLLAGEMTALCREGGNIIECFGPRLHQMVVVAWFHLLELRTKTICPIRECFHYLFFSRTFVAYLTWFSLTITFRNLSQRLSKDSLDSSPGLAMLCFLFSKRRLILLLIYKSNIFFFFLVAWKYTSQNKNMIL